MALKSKKKVLRKRGETGRVFINATFNNTVVTVTDDRGDTLGWGSSGRAGFKGTRKSTPFAATAAVEGVLGKLRAESGIKSVSVYIRGPGPGRDAALRAIRGVGLGVDLIADVTPFPHNGPRARKKRRA